jgi:hypothetical protein
LTCFSEEFQDSFDDKTLLTMTSRADDIIHPKSDFGRLYAQAAQATADIASTSYAPFKSTRHTLGVVDAAKAWPGCLVLLPVSSQFVLRLLTRDV